jgi:hypothetical protein
MENFYRDIYHYLIHTKNIPRSEIDTEIIMEIKKEFPSESLQNIATLYSQIYFTNLENQKRFQTFAQKDVNFPLLKKIIQQYPEKTDSELIQIYSELYSKYKQYYDLYHWKNYYLDSQIKLDSSIVEWQPLVDFFESVILSDPDLAGFCQQMKEGDFTHKIDPKTGQFLSVISTPEKKN